MTKRIPSAFIGLMTLALNVNAGIEADRTVDFEPVQTAVAYLTKAPIRYEVTSQKTDMGNMIEVKESLLVTLQTRTRDCYSQEINPGDFLISNPHIQGMTTTLLLKVSEGFQHCSSSPIIIKVDAEALAQNFVELDRVENGSNCPAGTECTVRSFKTKYSALLEMNSSKQEKPVMGLLEFVKEFKLIKKTDGTYTSIESIIRQNFKTR